VVGVGTLLNGGDELPLNVGVIVTVLGVDAGIGELGGTDVDEIDVVGGTDVGVPRDVVGKLQRLPAWRFWLAGHEPVTQIAREIATLIMPFTTITVELTSQSDSLSHSSQ
jgi:hypothetical protein